MDRLKKIFGCLLVVSVAISMLPVTVFAAECTHGTGIIPEEVWEMPELQTVGLEIGSYALDFGGTPALKSTNEVMWIDRLADLPDYATDFYNWLVENSNGDGTEDALIDPTTGTMYNGYYIYPVAELVDVDVKFTYPSDASDEEIGDAAAEAVSAIFDENLSDISSYAHTVYSAFDRDYPKVFWLSDTSQCGSSASYSYSTNGDGTGLVTYTQRVHFYLQRASGFDVRAEEYRTASLIYSAMDELNEITASVCAGASGTFGEQTAYLNHWLTANNCYNTSVDLSTISPECYECISALRGSTGMEGPVCEGYARAYKVLCDALEIPCVLVNGYTDSGEAHMWNNVQMDDGKWYAVDATWNDPSVNGVTGAVSGYENEEFFLVGSATVIDGITFGGSHLVTNIVTSGGVAFINGPVLEVERYEATATEPDHVSHETTLVPATQATCTETGSTAYYTCSGCDQWFADSEATTVIEDHDSVIIPITDHSYDSVAADSRGYITYTCSACGDSYTILAGDVNGDEIINMKDSVLLSRYVAKWSGYDETKIDLGAADVNGDGSVNMKDSVILSRYVAKWSGYDALPYGT